jgi:peptide/nickel transport system substrate-binding protein
LRGKRGIAALVAASSMIVLGTAGAASNVTFIYAGAADPTYLDPALVSDGESFRIARQIFDTLVQLKPGTTTLQPALARSWRPSRDGKTWTFTLRRGVKFHDGTAFNAAAVCANFNRWYNWTGPFQDATASFYYRQLFGGFRRNDPGQTGIGKPLYRSCRGVGRYVVRIRLNRRSGPFVPSLVLPAFAMQSPTAMRRYEANKGELVSGTFRPTGTYAFSHPTGTGPWKFSSWTIGQRVVLDRNNSFWGKRPQLSRIIVRPISNNTARLQALQTGEINGYDLVAPQDMPTIRSNNRLRLINRPPFNVAYVTINAKMPPMNNILVRRAVAHGLDRAGVVRSFYAGRAVVAHQFMPPAIPGYNPKVRKYAFNPERSRQLLRQAGLSLPVKIDFYWPTNVSRPYMPSPNLNFAAFKASLERSGFEVRGVSEPWRPDYVKHVNEGTGGHLNLIGWTGDYADADNFVGTFFQSANPQFGLTRTGAHGRIARLLDQAEATVNAAKRVKLYKQINLMLAEFVPAVPYAHSTPGVAVERRVRGYRASPVGTESFYGVTIGGQ